MNIICPTLFPSLFPKVRVIYNFFTYPESVLEKSSKFLRSFVPEVNKEYLQFIVRGP